jgi:phosphatidylserine/phosphatidylglycerophosphate/cardiolipin synthase-like enzyme
MKKLIYLGILLLSFLTFSLKVHASCEEMLNWDMEFIRHATQAIEISGSFCGGKILRQILELIDQRTQECPQLKTHILTSPILLEEQDKQMIKMMRKKYPHNFHIQYTANVFNLLPDYSTMDNHIKCVIIDEIFFSVGGTNLDESLCAEGIDPPPRNQKGGLAGPNLPAGTRDQDVVGRGPLAKELRETFFKLYALWEDYEKKNNNFINDPEFFKDKNRYFPINCDLISFVVKFETYEDRVPVSNVNIIFTGPMLSTNLITQKYTDLIENAKNEIVIANLYFNPVDSIMQAALKAVNRNVKFTLITNGCLKDTPSYNAYFCWANRINYAPIFYGREFHIWERRIADTCSLKNTQIYEYDRPDILYHKKLMVVDRRYTLIGSYNFGVKSHKSDYEMDLILDSPEIAERILKVIEKDITLSQQVSSNSAKDWYFDPIVVYIASVQRQFHGFM